MDDDFPMGIRIGTTVPGRADTADYIRQILPHGFESIALTFGHMSFDHGLDLDRLAGEIGAVLADTGVRLTALGVYGNPLTEDQAGRDVREGWRALIDHAAAFGTDLVAGFSGAVDGADVPGSVAAVAEVFRPLADRAADRGVRLAFENCPMGGTWSSVRTNTAICPKAWECLFEAIPGEHIGLQWEPCHQMLQLVDVIAQARQWAGRIFHIQGKDATIAQDILRTHGLAGGERWHWHRTPGFGDLDWTDLISTLRLQGWRGAIDIEGWHDPVYRGQLEMAGQVQGLRHLLACRGGAWIPPID